MSEEKKEQPEIPEAWAEIPIDDLIAKGYRLRRKVAGDRSYMTMRLGNKERSLGPYSDERRNLLLKLYPSLKGVEVARTTGPKSLLATNIAKPPPLKKSMVFTMETLSWYAWLKSKGYAGELGDFINEIVSDYFRREGLIRPVVIVREAS